MYGAFDGDRKQLDSLEKYRKGINGVKHKIRVQEAFAIPSRGVRGVRVVGDVGGPRGVSAPVNMISAMELPQKCKECFGVSQFVQQGIQIAKWPCYRGRGEIKQC